MSSRTVALVAHLRISSFEKNKETGNGVGLFRNSVSHELRRCRKTPLRRAARLRYIAGTAWSAKCYMNMRPLYQQKIVQTEAVA